MPSRKSQRLSLPQVRTAPSSDDVHAIVYFKRHSDDDPTETAPGRVFLRETCPAGVRAKFNAVLNAVAAAPPKRFAGGGAWEAMHGAMTGWFEVRKDGRNRHHYRLFCLLDYEADGQDKQFRTELNHADYAAVRELGDEYRRRNPRSIC